jgi:hypothetical protein
MMHENAHHCSNGVVHCRNSGDNNDSSSQAMPLDVGYICMAI